jgi:plasmid stabilization system protein ParE
MRQFFQEYMSYVVEMTDQARTDLRGIYEYIAAALQGAQKSKKQEKIEDASRRSCLEASFSLAAVFQIRT